MAGIIAGKDDKYDAKHPNATQFAGVAPDAQLLNMKVGAADGGADVSQVIAALDWVVEHRKDHGMNVRVVNLAYGTDVGAAVAGRPAGPRGRERLERRPRGRHRRRQRRARRASRC